MSEAKTVTGSLDVYLPHGFDAEAQAITPAGWPAIIWVRQPSRALKAGMRVTSPDEVQGAIFALVEDILATHAQDLPDILSAKSAPKDARPS